MRQFKIAFFDVDGTMIDMKTKKITDRMLYTLHALQDSGVKICMSTGRGPTILPDIPVQFDAYLTYNGGYCFVGDEVVHRNSLPHKDVLTVVKNATALGRPVAVSTASCCESNGTDEDLAEYFAIGKNTLKIAENFEEILNDEVYQFMLGCHPEDYPAILAGTDNAKIAAWWDRAADIVPADSGKGVGVTRIIDYFGFTKEEAISFGDGGNDIEMLQTTGTSVAMGNALENVKATATDVCGDCADDGIYEYCVEHGMIPAAE